MVAVYVKVMIVTTSNKTTNLSLNAHLPINRLLLQNLASSTEVRSQHKRDWRTVAWTKVDEENYYKLVNQLRSVVPSNEPFRKLEEHWAVTND